MANAFGLSLCLFPRDGNPTSLWNATDEICTIRCSVGQVWSCATLVFGTWQECSACHEDPS